MGIFKKTHSIKAKAWELAKNPSQEDGVILHTTGYSHTVRRIEGDYFYDTAILSSTGKAVEIQYKVSDYVFESD